MNKDERLILALAGFVILAGIVAVFDLKVLQIIFLFFCLYLGAVLLWEATK